VRGSYQYCTSLSVEQRVGVGVGEGEGGGEGGDERRYRYDV